MLAYYKLCSAFLFLCNIELQDSITQMKKQIETLRSIRVDINTSNTLIIANFYESANDPKQAKKLEALVNISNIYGLKFELVNLSLLQIFVKDRIFVSNYFGIADFLNSIMAVV